MGMTIMMKTSEKKRLLRVFETEARFWIRVFGMTDWQWGFGIMDAGDDRRAQCAYSCEGRCVNVFLNDRWLDGELDEVPDKDRVELSAFHEVCEVMLAQLEDTIQADPRNSERINTERHAIIRRMENVLFPVKREIARMMKGKGKGEVYE